MPELRIILRTERLVAVHKPHGVPVHRGWADDARPLLQRVRDALARHVYPVHRLDRATSGVLVMALDREAAARLALAFRNGAVDKRYWALVRGVPDERIALDHPVPKAKDKHSPRVPARTDFVRLESFPNEFRTLSLVEARPHTGRLHQIRRHLKHMSHPILGDVRYGKGELNRWARTELGLGRMFLAATRLTVPDPDDGGPRTIEAPLGDDLQAVLTRLRTRRKPVAPDAERGDDTEP